VLPAGIISGQHQVIAAAPRSGNLGGEEFIDWQGEFANSDRYSIASYKQTARSVVLRSGSVVETFAAGFNAKIGDEDVSVNAFVSQRTSRFGLSLDFDNRGESGAPTEREFAESSLASIYDIQASSTSIQRFTVDINLSFDYAGVENPSLRWQEGLITVLAEDGSELLVEPVADKPDVVLLTVNGEGIEVPYTNVFGLP